jgi:type I restriction enzyme S subunit
VIIGRKGAYRGVHYSSKPFCVIDTAFYLKAKADIDLRWAYYALLTQDINSMDSGSAIPSTSRGDFYAIPVKVPPRSEQQDIVRVLGTLDDKIALNHRLNETLESVARAIFKSWFVDFDPIRAKGKGREPSAARIYDLFPRSLACSELGKIPKGWRATTLGREAERSGGKIQTGPFGSQLHAADYVAYGVPVIMPQDISNRRVSIKHIAYISEADANRLSRHRLGVADIVYSRRGDVEQHAYIGAGEVGWLCGTGCLLVRMGPKCPAPIFMSLALDRPESRAWITQHAIGATMPNLNTSILSSVPLVVPPDEVLCEFGRLVDPIELLISANNAESRTLSTLRDALIPQLVSGRLRIADLKAT